MTGSWRLGGLAATCGCGLALLSGCSTAVDPSPSPTGAFAELVATYLDDPVADVYSEEQVAILTDAREAGALAFEDYAAAVDRTLECISTAGYYAQKDPVDSSRGFPTIGYFYESPEAGNPVAEACILENSSGVEAVYQLQPTSVQAEELMFDDELRALTDCFDRAGIELQEQGLEGRDLYREYNKLLMAEIDQGGPPGPIATCFGAGLE